MIEIGKRQKLKVKAFAKEGIYLNEEVENDRDVLLPKDQIIEKNLKLEKGDWIEVMVYNDSNNRILGTLEKSYGQVGDIVNLTLVSQTKFGSFMDWGLDKDIFLPLGETVGKVSLGKKYLVALYLDKSNRLCASMNLQKYLKTDHNYKINDRVMGTIYSINDKLGAFVAVENKYNGLIPREELIGAYQIGDEVESRVFNIKDDGKLDLALSGKAYNAMALDVNDILEKLKENKGFLPLNDKSSPEEIKEKLNMSKAAFKRATGNLYKEKMIKFEGNGIRLL